ncbi:MAG TPA: aminotransferase class I/II-fold pyridoxal phosphate-dependent enzyme [Actinomycetota bacterium]|nr:aminotransferase class I/II-fold pyridoxal phosphate-dependent enzyme [Actinomycetota bacterium]
MSERERGFTTRALRNLIDVGEARPVAPPIYQSATYAFDDPEVLAETIRRGKEAGFVYTRWHNPTRALLEEIVADLEGAERAVSFASGMAAISTVLATLARSGDHVVTSPSLYGGTHSVMAEILPRWGVEVTMARSARAEDVVAALRPDTAVCYVETIGNPTLAVPDLEAVAAACRRNETPMVVDNTFASPYLCNPVALGADVVVHSATKYLGGHADVTAGVAAGPEDLLREVRDLSIDLGGVAGTLDAWLAVRGIQTLALRMERHCATALELAGMLEEHPKVSRVWYPGLPSHPDHEVALRILRAGGGMVSFELADYEAGTRFQEALEIAKVAPSLGGTHTLAVHAASVTHTQLSPEQRRAVGITDGFIRVSVGLEDPEDLLEDFQRALEKV